MKQEYANRFRERQQGKMFQKHFIGLHTSVNYEPEYIPVRDNTYETIMSEIGGISGEYLRGEINLMGLLEKEKVLLQGCN